MAKIEKKNKPGRCYKSKRGCINGFDKKIGGATVTAATYIFFKYAFNESNSVDFNQTQNTKCKYLSYSNPRLLVGNPAAVGRRWHKSLHDLFKQQI